MRRTPRFRNPFARERRQPGSYRHLARTAVVIAAQTVCVAVGMWIHNCYVTASAEWTARETSFVELEEISNRLRYELSDRETESGGPDGSAVEYAAKMLAELTAGSPHESAIVNSSMQAVHVCGESPLFQIGDVVHWQSERSGAGNARAAQRGRVSTAGGLHPSMLLQLPDDAGTAVIVREQSTIVPDAAAIRAALPGGGTIAFVWIAGLQSVIAYLMFARVESERQKRQQKSDSAALKKAEELVRTQEAIIFGLARLAESRDTDTGQHLERISLYATRLANAMHRRPQFRSRVPPSMIKWIGISSALHDIGKVGVPDSVLKKPGRLTDEERQEMQSHTLIAGECLRTIEKRLGASNFLQMAREIAIGHHERWDGSGYPYNVAGARIPLAARIVAIADVYDALSNRRCYKEPIEHDKCVQMIRQEAGKQFDPEIVEVFLEIEREFRAIALQYGDRSTKPLPKKPEPIPPHARQILESIEKDLAEKPLPASADVASPV